MPFTVIMFQKCASLLIVGVDGGIGKCRKVHYLKAREFADEIGVPLLEVDLNSQLSIEFAHVTLVAMMVDSIKCDSV